MAEEVAERRVLLGLRDGRRVDDDVVDGALCTVLCTFNVAGTAGEWDAILDFAVWAFHWFWLADSGVRADVDKDFT